MIERYIELTSIGMSLDLVSYKLVPKHNKELIDDIIDIKDEEIWDNISESDRRKVNKLIAELKTNVNTLYAKVNKPKSLTELSDDALVPNTPRAKKPRKSKNTEVHDGRITKDNEDEFIQLFEYAKKTGAKHFKFGKKKILTDEAVHIVQYLKSK